MHALHRVCETIRVLYPNVDKLIANTKKVFVKSPSRVKIFKTRAPNTPLPPTPVITRWGTWVDAVKYYATNFELVYFVVNELDREDASSIAILQDVFQTPSELTALKNDLVFISANFCFLSDIITKLEKSKLLLTESLTPERRQGFKCRFS